MVIMKPEILSGHFMISDLRSWLSQEEYALKKVHTWLHLLNEGYMPVRWNKAYKTGTKVYFETLLTQHAYNEGLQELALFVETVNSVYGLELKVDLGGV